MCSSGCRQCGARCKVSSSHRAGGQQVQYLKCEHCQNRQSRVVDAATVWRRQEKTK